MAHVLEYFNLYHRMLEECDNEKETICLITDDLNKLGFSLDEVEFFINYYFVVEYNNENIHKYCELTFRFGIYSIDNDFINHIVNVCILEKHILLNIHNCENIVEEILDKLNKTNNFTDDDILHIIKCIGSSKIKSLDASHVSFSISEDFHINEKPIKLKSHTNNKITDLSIKYLTNLIDLDASCNENISDKSIIY